MNDYLRNGRFLALTVALLIVAGFSALTTLPRTEDPRVLNRFGFVITPFPGASAERVEALVSEPIETELRRLPEIDHIDSRSRPGLSMVIVQLKDSITDTQTVWSRTRDYIDDARRLLPDEVQAPQFFDNRGYAFTVLYALKWSGQGEADLGILNRYARELTNRMRGLPGAEFVREYGEPKEEVRVDVDMHLAAATATSPSQIADAIARADTKQAAGEIENAFNRWQVEVAGELDSLQRVRNVPLKTNSAGETLRVSDIADVHYGVLDPPEEIALIHGEPGIVVGVRMAPNLRIDQWRDRVDAEIARFEATLSENVALELLFDQEIYTSQRLGDLVNNLAVGFLLIVAVLLFTLGIRAALVVALALPLTALFTLACMKATGLPIHQMSVTGLVVALGIMVDNAIVMVDMIQQKRQNGKRALQAMMESIRHLWVPLLGSTLTTILAFSPIALMPGPAGEFVGGIALSVMFSLIGSYIISHTVIAGLAGRVLRQCPKSSDHWIKSGIHLPKLDRWFSHLVRTAIKHPVKTTLLVPILPIAGFISAGHMTEQFFPPADRDMFHIDVRLPPQSSILRTEALVQQISEYVEQEPGLVSQHWFIGNGAPSFYYNMMSNRDGEPQFAQAMVTTEDMVATNRMIPELQIALDDAFPQAQILVRKLEQGPPFNAPIELRLFGPDLNTLSELGDELRRKLVSIPNITHTRATLESAQPKIMVHTQEEELKRLGADLSTLALNLQTGLQGAEQGSILQATESLGVHVRIKQDSRGSEADLEAFTLGSPMQTHPTDHQGIPLSSIASTEIVPARGGIPRRDGQRVNVIEGYLRADVLPQSALDEFQKKLDASDFHLPAGYRLEVGGESSERDQAVGNLMASVGLIVTLLVVVVVLSFNSFRLSAIIFAVAFLSVGLGMLCVWAFGYPFGFTVIVGLMGLMGLAINAAIVIIAEIRSDVKASSGNVDAILHAVKSCTRHITSTTITTVGGFLPLILSGGGFWPPFAIAIAGGTVLATLLSFFFTPALFRVFARRRAF